MVPPRPPSPAAALLAEDSREARARIARRHRDVADAVALDLQKAFFRRLLDDRAAARRAALAARDVARVTRSSMPRAVADRLEGTLAHLEGRARTACVRLSAARERLEEIGELVAAGDVARAMVDVLMHAGRDAEAKREARRAERLYERAGGADARRLGSLAMNLGNLHHRRDEHARALEAYAAARSHFEHANEERRLANVAYNEANILATLDRTAEARELYGDALETFTSLALRSLAAQARYALAGVDLLESRLDEAVAHLVEVRRVQHELGESISVAHTDLELAECHVRLNRPDEAEIAARRAAGRFRKAGHASELAATQAVLAEVALLRGHARRAERLFERGLEIHATTRNAVAAARLRLGLARALLLRGAFAEAEASARRSARTFQARGLGSWSARALAAASLSATRAGRVRAGRASAERALELARRVGDARVELAARLAAAAAHEARGERDREFRQLRGAEACVERLRRGVHTDTSLLAFALDKSEVYERLILNRLQRDDPRSIRQALEFAERGKSRALADRLAGSSDTSGSPRARRILTRLGELERRLAVAEARIDESDRDGIRSAVPIARRDAQHERTALLARLGELDPGQAALQGALPKRPLSLLERLGDDELVLSYAKAGGSYHLFVATRDGVEAARVSTPAAAIDEEIERLRFQLGRGVLGERATASHRAAFAGSLARSFERLGECLLRPAAPHLAGRAVRIAPVGALHGLPFHALTSPDGPLIDVCSAVSYLPGLAAGSIVEAKRRRRRRVSPAVVIGSHDRHAPRIREEVEWIASRLGDARVFSGEQVRPDALLEAADGSSLLHVACHGFYADSAEGHSAALRLGERWTTLEEIFAMPGTAELVVLSGCETARGSVHAGDEWIGLVRAFFQIGARAVVGALWEVRDSAASAMMRWFYGSLLRGERAAAALTRAQRRCRDEDDLPLVWAPFALTGDPNFRLAAVDRSRSNDSV